MQIKINNLPKGLIELTVELSPEELKPYLEKAASELSKDLNISGFRPGKAPYNMVKKSVSEMRLYQKAAELVIPKTYGQAVIEKKIATIGAPRIEIQKLTPGNAFVYRATCACLPEVKLGNYKKIKISKKVVKVEKEEIEKAIINLQKMYGKEKRIKGPAKKGDKVELDIDIYLDKIPIDGGQSKNHPIIIGNGHFVPGFEENLIGLTENQIKEFKVKFPNDYHKKDLAGKHIEFKVEAKSIYEVELPNLNDQFAKMVGKFAKLSDLEKQIENGLQKQKEKQERQKWELAMIDRITEKSEFGEIPDILIQGELMKIINELETDATREGMKFDDYLSSIKKTREDLEKEFRPHAIKRIKSAIILKKIAEIENLKIEDAKLEEELKKQMEQYKNNQEILNQLKTEDYKNYLRNVLMGQKVFEFLEEINK